MPPIRVMLVDDSPLFVRAMQAEVEKQPNFVLAGTASNGQEALDRLEQARPDVIVCDVQMPRMDGIEFLKALLGRQRIPVVVISGTPGVTLTALANGAVDFIPKPASSEDREAFFKRMITTIWVAASSNVGAKAAFRGQAPHPNLKLAAPHADYVVAIGASTGGTDAILEVIRDLPTDFPPTLITQHMPAGFTTMYAERLNRECKAQVREVEDGDRLEPGLMLLARGDQHLRLARDARGLFASSKTGEKVSGHMPSVDVLFDSVARTLGPKGVGVILTGMGSDGATGLLRMRKGGAYTIGQDEASSVVYGMPRAAFERGAVATQLPLDDIPSQLVSHINKPR